MGQGHLRSQSKVPWDYLYVANKVPSNKCGEIVIPMIIVEKVNFDLEKVRLI